MDWLNENKDWLFSGLGIVVLTIIYNVFFRNYKKNNKNHKVMGNFIEDQSIPKKLTERIGLDEIKAKTGILFIDDDIKFKVVKILQKSGWLNTKIIKDCISLDQQEIVKANILFVDVQGIGIQLGFSDEGLGLALALKDKYPAKKVIIYSSETKGDRFHEALREADYSLAKNADPYEFQKIVEQFSQQ